MVKFDEVLYKKKKLAFEREWKRIEPNKESRRGLTKTVGKREEYLTDFTKAYNDVTDYLFKSYLAADLVGKIDYKNRQTKLLTKYKGGLIILKFKYDFQTKIFEQINTKNIINELKETETNTEIERSSTSGRQETMSDSDNNDNTDNLQGEQNQLQRGNMEIPAFLQLMAANIRVPYNGNPLALTPFLASIDFLSELATTQALQTVLGKFILTKLEGRAAEVIPTQPATIEIIITALREKIKPESSKVVEGKMMALRADRSSLQDYAKGAEELADAFRRALVIEGINLDKAEEMTIDKTIELCRANAQNNVVKSVLASSTFKTPRDVVTAYITETSKSKQEATVLAMRKFQHNNGNNNNTRTNNWRSNGNSRNVRGRYNNNYNRTNNWRGGNNHNNRNNRDNNRSNNYDNRGNGYNGNGNRGRGNSNSNSYRGNTRNNNQQNVRRVENATASQSTLGDAEES